LLGKKTLRFITKDGKAYKITPDDNVVPSIKEFIGKNKDNISELRFYDNKDAYTINKEGLMIHYWEEVVDKNNIPLESIIKENHVDLKNVNRHLIPILELMAIKILIILLLL